MLDQRRQSASHDLLALLRNTVRELQRTNSELLLTIAMSRTTIAQSREIIEILDKALRFPSA
jgi:hypothetical protein